MVAGETLLPQQCLRDVLHAAHGNARQIHLDEGFLHAAFPAAIPLDDGCFERDALETGHMERDVSGGSGKVPVIVAAAVALTGLAALVTGRLRQRLRLLLQQLVQGFFYAAADQFLDLTLDNFIVQMYNFLRHRSLSPFECLCGNFILPRGEKSLWIFYSSVQLDFTINRPRKLYS